MNKQFSISSLKKIHERTEIAKIKLNRGEFNLNACIKKAKAYFGPY